jgi:hypothetical protein
MVELQNSQGLSAAARAAGAHPESRVLALPNLQYTSRRRKPATPPGLPGGLVLLELLTLAELRA